MTGGALRVLGLVVVVGCALVAGVGSPAVAASIDGPDVVAGIGGPDVVAGIDGPGVVAGTGSSGVADGDVRPATAVDAALVQENATDEETGRLQGFDEVHTEFAVRENGSATVTVDYRYVLDDGNDTDEEWQALRDDIESDPERYVAAERERWAETVTGARNDTDREMRVTNVSVSTDESSTPREYGHVEFTLEWIGFAHTELTRIEAGDAIDGYMLDDDTTLQITWPASYNATVEPPPDERRESVAEWDGEETDFVEGEPRVELLRTDGESIEDPDQGGGSGGLTMPSAPWLVAFAALVVGGSVVSWYVGRGYASGGSAADGDAAVDSAPPDTAGDEGAPPSGPPPELLSNEERVLQLLAQRGGRVKQQDVVSALEWTEAKTSQVVGSLREDGEIDVFRIGRENVLVLPGADDGIVGGDRNGDATRAGTGGGEFEGDGAGASPESADEDE